MYQQILLIQEITCLKTRHSLNTIPRARAAQNASRQEVFLVLQRVGFSWEALKQGLKLYETAGIQVDLPALCCAPRK
jgi:hypothetical protein